MAGERALPGLGLKAFWTLGSNGWKPDLDQDLLTLSVVVQGKSLNFISSLPGSPTNGDIYIMTAGVNINQIAVRDNGAWVYIIPFAGWTFWNVADSRPYRFNGTTWAVMPSFLLDIKVETASKVSVLGDAGAYIRMSVGSANTYTVPPNSSVAHPVGTQITLRQAGAGQTTIVAGSGVTVNSAETLKLRKQGSTATLIQVAIDVWDVTGDMELL